jgi:hypothetical protein
VVMRTTAHPRKKSIHKMRDKEKTSCGIDGIRVVPMSQAGAHRQSRPSQCTPHTWGFVMHCARSLGLPAAQWGTIM